MTESRDGTVKRGGMPLDRKFDFEGVARKEKSPRIREKGTKKGLDSAPLLW